MLTEALHCVKCVASRTLQLPYMLSRTFRVRKRRRSFGPSFQRIVRPRIAAGTAPVATEAGDEVGSVPRAVRMRLALPTVKHVLRVSVQHSTNASGQIYQHAVVTDPSAAAGGILPAFTGWASLATLFDLYKVTSAMMEWYPYLPNDSSTQALFRPMVIAFDPDTDSAPASTDEVQQYGNARTFNIFKPFRYAIDIPKRSGTIVNGWLDVGNPGVEPASILIAADGLTASTAYGQSVWTLVLRLKSTR